ncbi:MAG: shikimate dehydrogenase [Chloroflexi bacterium]|nr:shikimate dehydrogenase [Chloroflexota bacterium]
MTRLAGIIGYPLKHSISPVFQQAAFDHLGLDVRFEAWETAPDTLETRVQKLRRPGVIGFNVTVPHKETVCRLLDGLDPWARSLGAVNTAVNDGGRLTGYNTDTYGFLRALRGEGKFEPRGKRALVLGAGGSARAIALALAREGVAALYMANRTRKRAQAVAKAVRPALAQVKTVPLEAAALRAAAAQADLIVNCTTLGMKHGPGEGETPMTADLIPVSALVYDIVYNPPETPLLREAKKAGARTLGGLPMLVYQGAEAFRLWTGRQAPLEVMFEAARKAL